jgi:hypothetical protein
MGGSRGDDGIEVAVEVINLHQCCGFYPRFHVFLCFIVDFGSLPISNNSFCYVIGALVQML